jgi:hypothetical protein
MSKQSRNVGVSPISSGPLFTARQSQLEVFSGGPFILSTSFGSTEGSDVIPDAVMPTSFDRMTPNLELLPEHVLTTP